MPKLLVKPSYQSELRYDSFDAKGVFEKEITIPTRTIWDVAWECATFMRIAFDNGIQHGQAWDIQRTRWRKINPSRLQFQICRLLKRLYHDDHELVFIDVCPQNIELHIFRTKIFYLTTSSFIERIQRILQQNVTYNCCIGNKNKQYSVNTHMQADNGAFDLLIQLLFFDTATFPQSHMIDPHIVIDFSKFFLMFERTFHSTIHFSTTLAKRLRRKIRQSGCFKMVKVEEILDIIVSYLLCN